MSRRVTNAFTLIEVLVAIAIFGALTYIAYAVLGQTLANADYLTVHMQRVQAIQRTVHLIDSDLMQAAPRPIRDELGDGYEPSVHSSFGSEFALEVTHGGWMNPAGLPRGTLQRSAYLISEDELIRYHWRTLDRTTGTEPVATVLLDGVLSLEFRYFDSSGDASEQWPPVNFPGPAGFRLRPRAVEYLLTLEDEGEIRRIVEIAP